MGPRHLHVLRSSKWLEKSEDEDTEICCTRDGHVSFFVVAPSSLIRFAPRPFPFCVLFKNSLLLVEISAREGRSLQHKDQIG